VFFLPRQSEAMGRIYDNRTTIGFERGEDPVRGSGDALGRMAEPVPISLEHHAGVRMSQTARDRDWIFSRLDKKTVGGVAKAVERDIGQFRVFEQRLEDASEEVALAKRRAGSRISSSRRSVGSAPTAIHEVCAVLDERARHPR